MIQFVLRLIVAALAALDDMVAIAVIAAKMGFSLAGKIENS